MAVVGTSFRRYTLEDTKRNHGPTASAVAFAISWQFGTSDSDPGVCRFMPSEPFKAIGPLSDELAETLEAYRDGATTPTPLAKALGIGVNTAKSRLRLLRERGELTGSEDAS